MDMNWNGIRALLQIMRVPGLIAVVGDWKRLVRLHFLYAAVDAGLFDALDAPRTREELAGLLAVKRPELLDALLDLGLASKQLRLRDGRYQLRGRLAKALGKGRDDSVAALIQGNLTYYNDTYRHAAARMRGAPLGDDLEEIGEMVARYSRLGEPMIRGFTRSLAKGRSPLRILDVGCGSGIYLRSAYGINPEAQGVGIDMDESVAAQARDNMEQWSLSDRFRILHGDVRTHPECPEAGFDLATLYNATYYLEEGAERREFFRVLKSKLAPGGTLAVVNITQSKGRDLSAANLNMVNCSLNGLTPLPSLDSYKTLLTDCGFSDIRIQALIPGAAFHGVTARVR